MAGFDAKQRCLYIRRGATQTYIATYIARVALHPNLDRFHTSLIGGISGPSRFEVFHGLLSCPHPHAFKINSYVVGHGFRLDRE